MPARDHFVPDTRGQPKALPRNRSEEPLTPLGFQRQPDLRHFGAGSLVEHAAVHLHAAGLSVRRLIEHFLNALEEQDSYCCNSVSATDVVGGGCCVAVAGTLASSAGIPGAPGGGGVADCSDAVDAGAGTGEGAWGSAWRSSAPTMGWQKLWTRQMRPRPGSSETCGLLDDVPGRHCMIATTLLTDDGAPARRYSFHWKWTPQQKCRALKPSVCACAEMSRPMSAETFWPRRSTCDARP